MTSTSRWWRPITFDEDEVPHFYWFHVAYQIAAPAYGVPTLIENIEQKFSLQVWPPSWHHEVQGLWRRIAIHECIQYQEWQMKQFRLPYKPNDRQRVVIENALKPSAFPSSTTTFAGR